MFTAISFLTLFNDATYPLYKESGMLLHTIVQSFWGPFSCRRKMSKQCKRVKYRVCFSLEMYNQWKNWKNYFSCYKSIWIPLLENIFYSIIHQNYSKIFPHAPQSFLRQTIHRIPKNWSILCLLWGTHYQRQKGAQKLLLTLIVGLGCRLISY